jgi:hypothetical protein
VVGSKLEINLFGVQKYEREVIKRKLFNNKRGRFGEIEKFSKACMVHVLRLLVHRCRANGAMQVRAFKGSQSMPPGKI